MEVMRVVPTDEEGPAPAHEAEKLLCADALFAGILANRDADGNISPEALAAIVASSSAREKPAADVLPPSPLADYKATCDAGRQLRTGYAHMYQLVPGVDRSAAGEFRARVRAQEHTGQTSGFAPGFVQTNFVALPKEHAFDFLTFALKNPKACPLLAVTTPGDPCPHNIAPGADLRSDIPKCAPRRLPPPPRRPRAAQRARRHAVLRKIRHAGTAYGATARSTPR